MKTIKVNKICRITDEDIAVHRNRLTAISVVALDDSKGFTNTQLSIEEECLCSEWHGANLVKNIEGDTAFVSKIEIYREDQQKPFNIKEFEEAEFLDEINNFVLMVVKGKDDDILAYGYAFNDHNGYYYHNVWIDRDNKNIYESEI